MHIIIRGAGFFLLLSTQILMAGEFKLLYYPYFFIPTAGVLFLVLFIFRKRGKKREEKFSNISQKNIAGSLSETKYDDGYQSDYAISEKADNTESLIEFLRIKSERPPIQKEMFNLNNVLNELAGSLAAKINTERFELIFDIEKNVPKYLLGDSLQLGNILFNLSKNMISTTVQSELMIKVRKGSSLEHDNEIVFELNNKNISLSEREKEILLDLEDDFFSGEDEEIEFYMAKVLITLMQGTLRFKDHMEDGTAIIIAIPLEIYKKNELRKYRLPNKSLTEKKVFLADSSQLSAEAIKNMLQYFKYDVQISREDLSSQLPDLSPFDIVLLDEKLYNKVLQTYLMQIKEKYHIKIIILSSVFAKEEYVWPKGLVDVVAKKPFSQERIYEVILSLYKDTDTVPILSDTNDIMQTSKYLIHREPFEDRVDISMESFSDFLDTSILIVEDNKINQRILTKVLGRSGIRLDIASNGQEALDMTISRGKVYDLVLMDINMPVMDGYTATAKLREDPLYETIPIVALSALILESEVEKMFAKGVSAYLSKPLRVGQLYVAFEFFLGKKQSSKMGNNLVNNLPELYGLDTTLGLANSDGSIITYIGILNEFISAYGKSDRLIRDLINDRKYFQAKILCSDMRQLSKVIGAKKMYDVADIMYKLFIYDNREMLPKYIESYRRELEKLQESIEKYLKGVEV